MTSDVEPGDDGRAAQRTVRLAWAADVPGIAAVQLAALQASLPASVAAMIPRADVEHAWRVAVTRPPSARHRVLVATVGDRPKGPASDVVAPADLGTTGVDTVVGFVSTGPAGDPDATEGVDGEVLALHTRPADDEVAAALLAAGADTLEADGFTRGQLWVAAGDDALRAVADRAGWVADGAHRRLEVDVEVPDAELPAGRADRPAGLSQVRLHTGLVGDLTD